VADAQTVLPLRRAVLRPHQPPEAAAYPEDDRPDTVHLAAYGPEGVVVGVATFFPEPLHGQPAWRLRGMAAEPRARGQGYGSALLERGIQEVRRRGGALLWCNARSTATAFYLRHGFQPVSEEFDLPPLGPHYVMGREI